MTYKQSSIDIIGNIISSLTFPVTIITATNLGSGKHSLEVDDMYHAQPGFEVTIAGKKYIIEDIMASVNDECGTTTMDVIKIKGDATNITATTFTMYSPHFFYGTPMAEGTELSAVISSKDKTPMYWLRLDDFSEHFIEDKRLRNERELKIRLYPLSFSDHEKWVTSQAKQYVVDPMRRLAEIFVNAIRNSPERYDRDNLTWDIPAVYPKFGVISINRGVEKSLWHDKLGGVELAMTLIVYKNNFC